MTEPRQQPQRHYPRPEQPRLIVSNADVKKPRIRPVWIYDNMVKEVVGQAEDGGTVHVWEGTDRCLGSAIYNSQSKIRARIFTQEETRFDGEYVAKAVEAAVARRRAHFSPDDSFRAVFGEADGLPGLVADKLGKVLVVQIVTLAADRMRERLIAELRRHLVVSAVVVRGDTPVRAKEGLPLTPPHVRGEPELPLRVEVDGVALFCDPVAGHKTGLYLDQRYNRRLVAPHWSGARVLDLFCHVGAWSLAAARGGAREVVGVDSSGPALEMARRAIAENDAKGVTFEESDVFDWAAEVGVRRGKFDVVVCDPPAFAKTRAQATEAGRAYLSLNYRAMKLVAPGGVLVTCSCSQHVGRPEFEDTLEKAARNARVRFQVEARGGQPPDHPVLLGFPESDYLKCAVLRRVE